jgi:outer membrane lipoprotein-sorting protein
MKDIFKYGFGVTVLTAVGVALSAVNASGQRTVVAEIIHRMDMHSKALQTLKADVRMEMTEAQVGVTDVNTGTTSYVAKSAKNPTMARLDWISPREEHLIIKGDSYDLYVPKSGQRYVGSLKNVKGTNKVPGNALAFINMSRDQLIANYEVDYDQPVTIAGVPTWHLILTPKLKTDYKFADLWVDANGMPIQARTTAKNNDTTTILLTNIQKNVTIKMDIFRQNAPDGIRPVRG